MLINLFIMQINSKWHGKDKKNLVKVVNIPTLFQLLVDEEIMIKYIKKIMCVDYSFNML